MAEEVDDREFLETFVRQMMEKVDRELHRFTIASGTVSEVGHSSLFRGAYVNVNLDEDVNGKSKQVPIAVGTSLRSGDRVLVAFDPPHGGYIIGVIDGINVPCSVGSFAIYGRNSASDYLFLEDNVENGVTLSCGFELDDFDGDGTLDSILIPEDGVYHVSAGFSWSSEMFPDGDAAGASLMLEGPTELNYDVFAPGWGPVVGTHQLAARSVFCSAGDHIWVEGEVLNLTGADWSASALGSLSIHQLCCDFVPGEPGCS